MKAILIRQTETLEGTIGILIVLNEHLDLVFKCYTLELPNLLNQRRISSIPKGIYNLKKRISKKFGKIYDVLNVINRSFILIHAGNTIADTKGCILVGLGVNVDTFTLTQSKSALEKLYNLNIKQITIL